MSSTNTYINQKYCVYNITYFGNKLPSKNNSNITPSNYIGSTEINKIKSGYMGSVKSKIYKNIWKSELKDNINLFSIEIISYHETRKEALWKELQIQKIFNVVTNPLFVNMSYAQPNGFFGRDVSGKNNPNYNNKWTLENRKKQSERAKIQFTTNNPNKNPSIEKRKQMSERMLGENNPMHNKKHKESSKELMSSKRMGENNPFYMKSHTIETKLKISKKNKHRIVPKEIIEKQQKTKKENYSKKQFVFKDKSNNIFTITDIDSYCNMRNLHRGKLIDVHSGFCKAYKEHYNINTDLLYLKLKSYNFIDPIGNVVYVENLKEFCKQHSLGYTTMVQLGNGKYRKDTYKGYTNFK